MTETPEIDAPIIPNATKGQGDFLLPLKNASLPDSLPVRQFQGHGIGEEMHEDPGIPNYGKAGRGIRLEGYTRI